VQQLGQPRPREPLRALELTTVSHRITSLMSDISIYIRFRPKVKSFFKCEFAPAKIFTLTDGNYDQWRDQKNSIAESLDSSPKSDHEK
jgi:hypothetical protein